ncbi:MAG: carboxypeptidase regulatory-like domain-containing protein [Burkholderiaceae bacterium]|nr:MAG: carboxypeptidase regulatory-like domain-containing protein [Burkholderiaceae bacterium]
MSTRIQGTLARWGTVAAAAAMVLGLGTAGTSAAAQSSAGSAGPPAAQTVGGVSYLNGGIGEASQKAMRRDAANWPLRMTFSESANNDYVADVKLDVRNRHGQDVLMLNDAGPLTYVRLKPGEYRISAEHRGKQQVRTVNVGLGTEVNFHWKS